MTQTKTDSGEIEKILARERPRRRGIIITSAIILLIILAIFWGWSDEKATPVRYTTATLEQGDLTVQVTATGTLEPLNQVDVGSEVSGTIDSVRVDFNDRVSKGEVLARLNTDEQSAKVVQSRAALEVSQAKVKQADATVLETRLKLNRCQTLSKQGLCTPQDLDADQAAYARAQADLASAKAQVSQARATLEAEETRLSKAVIRSPIDGIVLKRQIEPGQTVAASLQAPVLFTLAENLSQMELKVDVDEADIGKVKEGQSASFTVDAYSDRVFPARITQVRLAPQSEGGVVSYETILSLDNRDLLLRPGMTATAHITVEQIHNALLAPNAALRFEPPATPADDEGGFMDQLFPRWGRRERPQRQSEGKQVWLLQNGQPSAVKIKTGPSDGRMTQIFSDTLQAGAKVIVDATNTASR
jgi:HlyD family secretion protein